MRRFLNPVILVSTLFLLPSVGNAQIPIKKFSYLSISTASVLTPIIDNINTPVWQVAIHYVSTATTCNFEFDDSPDNVTWTVNGTVNCATGSTPQDIFRPPTVRYRRYQRINVTSLSGGTLQATYYGYPRAFVTLSNNIPVFVDNFPNLKAAIDSIIVTNGVSGIVYVPDGYTETVSAEVNVGDIVGPKTIRIQCGANVVFTCATGTTCFRMARGSSVAGMSRRSSPLFQTDGTVARTIFSTPTGSTGEGDVEFENIETRLVISNDRAFDGAFTDSRWVNVTCQNTSGNTFGRCFNLNAQAGISVYRNLFEHVYVKSVVDGLFLDGAGTNAPDATTLLGLRTSEVTNPVTINTVQTDAFLCDGCNFEHSGAASGTGFVNGGQGTTLHAPYFDGYLTCVNNAGGTIEITGKPTWGPCTTKVTGGTILRSETLVGSGSFTFGIIPANSCSTGTLSVTGAADGDAVTPGIPNAIGSIAGIVMDFWISAANVVSFRVCNVTTVASANIPAATIKAVVTKQAQ